MPRSSPILAAAAATLALALACGGLGADPNAPATLPDPCAGLPDCTVFSEVDLGGTRVVARQLDGTPEDSCPRLDLIHQSEHGEHLLARLCEDPAPTETATVVANGEQVLATSTTGGAERVQVQVRVDVATGVAAELTVDEAYPSVNAALGVQMGPEGPPTGWVDACDTRVEGAPIPRYGSVGKVSFWEKDLAGCGGGAGLHAIVTRDDVLWVQAPADARLPLVVRWSDGWLGDCDASPAEVHLDATGALVKSSGGTRASAEARRQEGRITWRIQLPQTRHPWARGLGLALGDTAPPLMPLANPRLGGWICGMIDGQPTRALGPDEPRFFVR